MVIWTARFSKKAKAVLLVIALGAVAAVVILLTGGQDGEKAAEIRLATNDDRVAYLQSLGWTVEPEPVETLFYALPEVYVNDFFRKLVVSGTPLYQKKLHVSVAPGSLIRLKTRTESGGQFFALGKAGTDESGDAVIRLEKLFIL